MFDIILDIQCTMCTLYSFFSSRPSEVRLILKSPKCCTIQHKFVPARSVERNIEKIRFPWASNSKFVIFSQIFPRSNYKICPIIPRLFPVSNGDSPVSTTFPRSNYRGFFTTGESYCTMYTLCNVQYALYIVQCTMYNAQCTMHNVQCTSTTVKIEPKSKRAQPAGQGVQVSTPTLVLHCDPT